MDAVQAGVVDGATKLSVGENTGVCAGCCMSLLLKHRSEFFFSVS